MKTALSTTAALALGVTLGWWWFRPVEASGATRATPPTKSARPAARPPSSSSPVNARGSLLDLEPPADRLRAIVRFANTLPKSALAEWAGPLGLRSGDPLQDGVFARIVTARLTDRSRGESLLADWKNRSPGLFDQFRAWMRDDPDTVLRFVTETRSGLRWKLGEIALEDWARSDPQRALALLDGLARTTEIGLGFQLARKAGPLAESHRDELVALSHRWSSQWRHCFQVAAAEPGWRKDPAGTIAWMQAKGMSADVFAKLVGDVDNSSREGPVPSVFDHLDALPRGWLEAATLRADHAVVRQDPQAWLAADAGTLGVPPDLFEKLQVEAADQLRNKGDPLKFMAGATPAVQAALAVTAVNQGYYQDKEGTARWIASLQDAKVRESAQQRFDVLDAPDEAYPWMFNRRPSPEILPAGADSPEQVDRSLRERITMSDRYDAPLAPTGEAFHHILEHSPKSVTGEISKRLVDHAVRWGKEDPRAAATWAANLPDQPERTWALRNVARQWASRSPSELQSWANTLPDPADRAVVAGELP